MGSIVLKGKEGKGHVLWVGTHDFVVENWESYLVMEVGF